MKRVSMENYTADKPTLQLT